MPNSRITRRQRQAFTAINGSISTSESTSGQSVRPLIFAHSLDISLRTRKMISSSGPIRRTAQLAYLAIAVLPLEPQIGNLLGEHPKHKHDHAASKQHYRGAWHLQAQRLRSKKEAQEEGGEPQDEHCQRDRD